MQTRNRGLSPTPSGLFAPLVRAATHVGFLFSLFLNEENTDGAEEEMTAIQTHVQEAKDIITRRGTIDGMPAAFTGNATIEAFTLLEADINTLLENVPTEREERLNEITALAHNIAYTAVVIEQDITGNTEAATGLDI